MITHTTISHVEKAPVVVREHREAARPVVVKQPVVVRPIVERGHGRVERPVIVEHTPVVYAPTVVAPTYVAPSYTYTPAALQLQAPTALGSELILNTPNGELASSSSLELDASGSGQTYVSSVSIEYANGSSQTIAVNAMLGPSSPTYRIALGDGCDIAQIRIDGHSAWNSAIAINAR